jgi:hypothetical protein
MKTEITNERFLEVSSEIAEAYLERNINPDLVCVWEEDENGDLHHTEEAQDLFNETLDTVQAILIDYFSIINQ